MAHHAGSRDGSFGEEKMLPFFITPLHHLFNNSLHAVCTNITNPRLLLLQSKKQDMACSHRFNTLFTVTLYSLILPPNFSFFSNFSGPCQFQVLELCHQLYNESQPSHLWAVYKHTNWAKCLSHYQ